MERKTPCIYNLNKARSFLVCERERYLSSTFLTFVRRPGGMIVQRMFTTTIWVTCTRCIGNIFKGNTTTTCLSTRYENRSFGRKFCKICFMFNKSKISIEKTKTSALRSFVMAHLLMSTETFMLWSNENTVHALRIHPGNKQSIMKTLKSNLVRKRQERCILGTSRILNNSRTFLRLLS